MAKIPVDGSDVGWLRDGGFAARGWGKCYSLFDVNILFVGDVFGPAGRRIVREHLGHVVETNAVDLLIINGENAAGGFESCRNEIEQAASAKYDSGQLDYAGGIYVTSVEFPPHGRG